jgi:hypothetical protein
MNWLLRKTGLRGPVIEGHSLLPGPPGDAPDGRETIAWFDAARTLESKKYRL